MGDSEEFAHAMTALEIKRVKVQRGDGFYDPKKLANAAKEAGLEVEVITFSPTLPEELKTASLVISHAGAGTVLDCLNSNRRTLIVPNEELADNQELKFCEELKKYGLARWSRPGDI